MNDKEGALHEDPNGAHNDYVLKEGEDSVWVKIDGIVLYIRRHVDSGPPTGVIVEAMPSGDPDGQSIDTMFVSFDQGTP